MLALATIEKILVFQVLLTTITKSLYERTGTAGGWAMV
jgi:hypothetical protein